MNILVQFVLFTASLIFLLHQGRKGVSLRGIVWTVVAEYVVIGRNPGIPPPLLALSWLWGVILGHLLVGLFNHLGPWREEARRKKEHQEAMDKGLM